MKGRGQQRSRVGHPLAAEALQQMWEDLNALYFSGRLPPIQIFWSSRLTSTAGLFISQSGPRQHWVQPEERHGTGRVIRLSLPLHQEQPISTIRSTLAHEMIHQWQFDVKKCRPSHGREFRRIMELMNRDGLGITVYHSLPTHSSVTPRFAWQCMACGRSYTRQRKSVSVKRHRCGECHGTLREILPNDMPHPKKTAPATRTTLPASSSSWFDGPIQLSFPFSRE